MPEVPAVEVAEEPAAEVAEEPAAEVAGGEVVAVIGVVGGEIFGAAARQALGRADVVVGAPRHLAALDGTIRGVRVALGRSLPEVLDEVAVRAGNRERVAILTSGDPGFFGLARLAAARLGPQRLAIHPAPSAVSLAFARLGESWDDARVVSAHGRPLAAAVDAVLRDGPGVGKVAVLVGPDQPPQVLGQALLGRGAAARVAVCARLGQPDESVVETDVAGLAGGTWDPLSVVVLRTSAAALDPSMDRGPVGASLAWDGSAARLSVAGSLRQWGRPEEAYRHRAGMITKAEVRAVVLSKLALPSTGVCWDVGAGSGSVCAEVAALAPGLEVFAVERRADDVSRIRSNTAGLAVQVVEGEAPAALAGLPDPDRAFVGGGGIGVLDEVLRRLRPGGVVVASFSALDRAAAAHGRLGQLVQVAVSRGLPVGGDGAIRLQAENPVFVCWGPRA